MNYLLKPTGYLLDQYRCDITDIIDKAANIPDMLSSYIYDCRDFKKNTLAIRALGKTIGGIELDDSGKILSFHLSFEYRGALVDDKLFEACKGSTIELIPPSFYYVNIDGEYRRCSEVYYYMNKDCMDMICRNSPYSREAVS